MKTIFETGAIMEKNKSELLAKRAIYCVELRRSKGRWIAARHAAKHGVSGLYRLALQLEAVKSFKE